MARRAMQLKHIILGWLTPIQKFIQQLGYIESDFTPEIINALLVKIKPGDVLGSYESGRFTSAFIKGNFDHVAIVDENLYVVEAVGDKYVDGKNVGGVRRVKLETWLWKKNHVFVARHPDEHKAFLAARETSRYVGKSYDYRFELDDECLYCAELPYVCFKPHDEYFMCWVHKDDEILPVEYLGVYLDQIYNSRIKLSVD